MRLQSCHSLAFAALAVSVAIAATGCGDDPDGAESSGGGGAGDSSSTASASSSSGAETWVEHAPVDCAGTPTDNPTFERAMDLLREKIDVELATGGAVVVLRGDEIVDMGVAGSRRAGGCYPVTEDTLFQLAFSSGTLTTIAALDAVEDGLFDLDTPIVELLPTLRADGPLADITVHHLLTFGSMFRVPSDDLTVQLNAQRSACGNFDEVFLHDATVQAAPGSMEDDVDVSNLELLGWILETVDGVPFPELIRARVLDPLGIGGGYETDELQAVDHALGRYRTDPADLPLYAQCRNRDPSLGYHGSIRDVAGLLASLRPGAPGPLEESSRTLMLSQQDDHFMTGAFRTYGFFGYETMDLVVSESYASGFCEETYLFVEEGLTVVTLLNVGDTFVTVLGRTTSIAEEYTSFKFPDPEYPVDPAAIPSLLGTYVDEHGFESSGPRTFEIVEVDGALYAELTGAGTTVQYALSGTSPEDNFLFTDITTEQLPGERPHAWFTRFWRDDDGAPYALQIFGDCGPPFLRVEGLDAQE